LASGVLPAGLALSGSGTISGTPAAPGPSSFTVQVVSSDAQTVKTTLTLTVNPANPIALVQSNMAEGASQRSLSVRFPSSNHAGNLIIAFVRMSTTSETVTVSDSAGNVYKDAISQVQTVDGHQVHVFYAKNAAGISNSVTAHFSSRNSHPWLAIYEYSGLSTTTPLDQTAHAQGNGSAAGSGTAAMTSSAYELVFAAAGLPAGYTGAVTTGTGYSMLQQDTGTPRAANEAAIVNSSGSFAGVFGLNPGTNWTAVLATFKP
jgi:hypothetical protein